MITTEDFPATDINVAGPQEQQMPLPTTSSKPQPRYVSKRQQLLSVLTSDTTGLFNGQILVRHIMTPAPQTIAPEETVEAVSAIFARLDARHLLVCERDGRLVGVLSNRDLNKRLGITAHQIMTPNPITVAPSTSVHSATTLMLHNHIACVPVVENDRVCGILTTTDIMMTLQCCLRIVERLPFQLRKAAETKSPTSPVDNLMERLLAESN